jgi:hypothetical protein
LMIIPVATVRHWWGGWCYGPRLLADITPILCLFLIPSLELSRRHIWLKYAVAALTTISIGLHILGAYTDISWNEKHRPERNPGSLWSLTDSPPVYNAKQLIATVRQETRQRWLALKSSLLATPTSFEAPQKLAASYRAVGLSPELVLSPIETLRVHVKAQNLGEAIWLMRTESDGGAVRMGWRWYERHGEELVAEGRKWLPYDVFPGESVEIHATINPPSMPGEYILEIGMVCEPGLWFSSQGIQPVRRPVRIVPRKPS